MFDQELRLARGGHFFLPGWDKRTLWHLPEGEKEWEAVHPSEGWWGEAYDKGTQDFYVGFGPKSRLLRWDGEDFVPAGPMPTAYGDATSGFTEDGLPRAIITLPKAGGTFAVAVDWYDEDTRSLWFRPFDGDWTLVADTNDLGKLAPGLRFPGPLYDADVSEDGRTVRLFAGTTRGEANVLLRKSADDWILESATPFRPWVTHRDSNIRLAWIGENRQELTRSFLFFFEQLVAPEPPVLVALYPGTLAPTPLPGIEPASSQTGTSVFYTGYFADLGDHDPLLIRAADGWYSFDGKALTALPSLTSDRVGDLASIRRIGPIVVAQSPKGIFVLNETLEAKRVDTFPDPEPYSASASIDYLEAAGIFVIKSGNGAVHVSVDFTRFDVVPSPSAISTVVAPLPDRPGLLLVGSDGLYTFEAECPIDGE